MTRDASGGGAPDKRNEDKPHVIVHAEQCKGCGRCIVACPAGNLALSSNLNANGYRAVEVVRHRCRGCGLCYYSCPEPGALTVIRGPGKGGE